MLSRDAVFGAYVSWQRRVDTHTYGVVARLLFCCFLTQDLSSRCALFPTSCYAPIRMPRLSDALWGYAFDSACGQVMQDSASVAWRHPGPQLTLLRKVTRPACRVHPTRWGRAPAKTLRQGHASHHEICLQYNKCRSARQPLSMVLDFKCCSQLAVIRFIELCPAVRSARGKLTFGRPRRLTPTEWSSGRTSRTILQVMPWICEPRICADPTMPRLPGQTMRVRCLFNGAPSFGQAHLGFRCHGLMDRTLDSTSIHMSVCLCRASRLWYQGILPRKLVCCFDIRSLNIARAHVTSTEAACANLSTIVTYEGSQSVREAAMTTHTAGSSSLDPLRPHVDAVSFVASSSSQRHAQQPHTHESGNRRDTSVDCLSQAVVAAGSPVQAGVSGLVAATDSSPVDHRVFNKAIHSRDGLPTCAACGEHFSRWSGLRKHIVKGYCAVLHSVVPIGPPTVVHNFVPIALRPSVQETVSRWGISGMLGFPDVMKEMLQRCVLCHQWVASSWQMKNHFRNSRPDFWKTHHASCDAYCKQQGERALVCKYCCKISDVRGGALAHMKRCTVLWQIAVIHHYLKHGGANGCTGSAGRILRQGSDRVSSQASPDNRGRGAAPSKQGRRVRQGTKGPPQGYYRGLDRGQSGADSVHLQSACSARRQRSEDTAWVWFLRTDKPTIVPQLFQAAAAWKHEANQPTPGLVGRKPLREIIFLTILRNLSQNIKSFKADPDHQQTCKQQGWITQEGMWQFQKWCPDSRTLKVDTARSPLSTDAILQVLAEMMEAVVVAPVLHRFHSTRKITLETTGIITMIMDVGQRKDQGGRIYLHLEALQACAVWQMLGVQLKRETLKRSPLVDKIQQMVSGRGS